MTTFFHLTDHEDYGNNAAKHRQFYMNREIAPYSQKLIASGHKSDLNLK